MIKLIHKLKGEYRWWRYKQPAWQGTGITIHEGAMLHYHFKHNVVAVPSDMILSLPDANVGDRVVLKNSCIFPLHDPTQIGRPSAYGYLGITSDGELLQYKETE